MLNLVLACQQKKYILLNILNNILLHIFFTCPFFHKLNTSILLEIEQILKYYNGLN